MKSEKGEPKPKTLSKFMANLQGHGRHTFTKQEAMQALQTSENAFHLAISRLAREKRVLRVANEFYVIVPVEYQTSGGLPSLQYIDDLMKFREQPYYVGVLSAASLHGAAHQAPQELQVVTSKQIPTFRSGRTRIRFLYKRKMDQMPVQSMKTQTGYIKVSTPEATAFDLLLYPRAAAGLNNIATVLKELSEVIDAGKLRDLAKTMKPTHVQRLGYLLEQVGWEQIARPLIDDLKERRWDYVPLLPSGGTESQTRDPKWRIVVNELVDPDI